MPVIEFISNKNLDPLFGLKLSVPLQRLCKRKTLTEQKKMIKRALNISEERVIKLKEVGTSDNKKVMIVIIYDITNPHMEEKLNIPQTDGYFDFPIYNINYNEEIDIEEMIKKGY